MPQVRLGVGQHYTIDSDSWFPVNLGLHLVPDENKEVPADMLDLSGQVAFSGYVQTGMKFSGDIFTASWIKKIFRFALGTYLYAGPKVSGEFVVSADIPTDEDQKWAPTDTYETLEQSQLNVALLSLDLEAKGHFSVFSKEGEKKFFDKNWSFLTDTVIFAPHIQSIDTMMGEDHVRLRLNVGPGHTLGYCWAEIGIYEDETGLNDPIEKLGSFNLMRVTEEQARKGFFVTCPYEYKKHKKYYAVPIVHVGGIGEFPLWKYMKEFIVPSVLYVSPDAVTIPANGGEVEFMISTNTQFDPEWGINIGLSTIDKHIDTLNADKGIYKFTCVMDTNRYIFGSSVLSDPGNNTKQTDISVNGTSRPITVTQELMDLSRLEVYIDINKRIKIDNENWASGEYYMVLRSSDLTATRINNHQIHISGSRQKTVDGENLVCSVDLTVQYVDTIPGVECHTPYELSGTIQSTGRSDHLNNTTYPINVNLTFDDKTGSELNVYNEHNTSTERTDYTINLYPTGYPYPGEE